MKKDFPGVEDFCRLHDADLLLSNDEKNVKFSEEKGYYADPSFLRMFNVTDTERKSGYMHWKVLINLCFQKQWQKNILGTKNQWAKDWFSVTRSLQEHLK